MAVRTRFLRLFHGGRGRFASCGAVGAAQRSRAVLPRPNLIPRRLPLLHSRASRAHHRHLGGTAAALPRCRSGASSWALGPCLAALRAQHSISPQPVSRFMSARLISVAAGLRIVTATNLAVLLRRGSRLEGSEGDRRNALAEKLEAVVLATACAVATRSAAAALTWQTQLIQTYRMTRARRRAAYRLRRSSSS